MMMPIGMDNEGDGGSSLHNVPFALLDVDAVAAQHNTSNRSWSSLPGLVQESGPTTCGAQLVEDETASSSIWSSSSSFASDFPREIALRVLSSSHYRVHTIRIVFQTAKRPSRLDMYGAKANSSLSRSGPGFPASLDPLSQYFSSSLEPLCSSISWPPETALTWPLRPTQVQIPVVHSTENTAFLKFLVHQPHPHPDNPKGDVVIQELELLGTFQLPGRFVVLQPQISDPHDNVEIQPVEAENDEIRDFLKAAGLSEELIRELLLSTTTNTTISELHQSATRQSKEVYQTPTQPTGLVQSEQQQQHALDSVFDLALRDFVHRRAQQDELFASLATHRFYSTSTESSITTTIGSQLPRIHCDAASSYHHYYEAIAIHTFGSFYTQCLLHEDTEVRAMSLQVAERLAPLLPDAGMSLELVYEGLLAIVVLALEAESSHNASPVSLSVFYTALHLIQTTFQERGHGFRLVRELPTGKLNTGLETILRSVLRLPHCWSLGARTTINRELLKTVRLLLRQETTRASFLLAVCLRRSHDHTQKAEIDRDQRTHLVTILNRLRLMRWLLQRHRDMLSSDDTASIQHVCEQLCEKGRTVQEKAIQLAQQCLQLLLQQATRPTEPAIKDLDAQLVAMKRHLQQQNRDQHHEESTVDAHIPLFDAFPLSAHERTVLVGRLTEYFHLHKRPSALYRHEFTISSLQDHDHDGGVFQKGNIVFKGHVEERTVPHVPFTQEIRRNTKPFEFHAPQVHGHGRDRITEVVVETAFAAFHGTVEPRGNCHAMAVPSTPCSSFSATSSRHLAPDVIVTPRRSSNNGSTKLSRVVPVVDVDLPVNSQPVVVDTPVAVPPRVPASERRVSSAAPPSAQAGSGRFADPIPNDSPTKTSTTIPKTAPVGKPRGTATSQGDSSGCVIQ